MFRIIASIALAAFSLTAGTAAAERIDFACGSEVAAAWVTQRAGICPANKGWRNNDETQIQRAYHVMIVGAGVTMEAGVSAVGFICESYQPDPDWQTNVGGYYYGYQGSLVVLGGGGGGVFYNSRGKCYMSNLTVGGGGGVSAGILWIEPR